MFTIFWGDFQLQECSLLVFEKSVGYLLRSCWQEIGQQNKSFTGRPKFFGYMSSNQTPLVTTPTRESPLVARSATSLEFVKSVASEVIGDLEVDEPLTTATWLNVRKIPLPKEFAPGGRAPNGKISEPTPVLQVL